MQGMLWLVQFSATLGEWAEPSGAAGTSAEIPQIRLIPDLCSPSHRCRGPSLGGQEVSHALVVWAGRSLWRGRSRD